MRTISRCRAVLRSQAKTNVTFRDHDSAQGNIRIEAVERTRRQRFSLRRQRAGKDQGAADASRRHCGFFAADGKRLGDLDTTPTHHANGTPMYKVSVHPPGTVFPANGFPSSRSITRTTMAGPVTAAIRALSSIRPPTANTRFASPRAACGGINFGYRLTVRPPQPSFKLRYAPQKLVVSKGAAVPITITAERIDGFDGPIAVGVKQLLHGLDMPETTIEAGTYATTVRPFAEADAKLPAKPFRHLFVGSASTGDAHLGQPPNNLSCRR